MGVSRGHYSALRGGYIVLWRGDTSYLGISIFAIFRGRKWRHPLVLCLKFRQLQEYFTRILGCGISILLQNLSKACLFSLCFFIVGLPHPRKPCNWTLKLTTLYTQNLWERYFRGPLDRHISHNALGYFGNTYPPSSALKCTIRIG